MYQKPKGTYDVLPTESKKWQILEKVMRDVSTLFNYKEIRTPIFEKTELYHRAAGETSDIVSKETYDFPDRKGRMMSLRPEGTAGVIRSYIENKLYADGGLTKLFYIGPNFRYERSQKGRYRQHIQFGVEAIGSSDPKMDAEVISLAVTIYQLLGLKGLRVKINSLGDQESRDAYREALIEHFEPNIEEFCGDCQNRLSKNPLRVLDCKVDHNHALMKSAPKMMDFLNEESKEFFTHVLSYLDAMGIDYEVDHNLVRGLDYYSHTVFEVQADIKGFGSQNTLCGGGRYDGLVEDLGGPATPAVGFGMGIERLLLALEAEEIQLTNEDQIDVFLMTLGEESTKVGTGLMNHLRLSGFITETDFQKKKMKAQFKNAERQNASFIIILGDDELANGTCNVKTVALGTEEKVAIAELVGYLEKQLYAIHVQSHSCDHDHDECCGGESGSCGCNHE